MNGSQNLIGAKASSWHDDCSCGITQEGFHLNLTEGVFLGTWTWTSRVADS